MGIGKFFHKRKDGQGDSPQQLRRFRSRRGSADLGTSPYATAETAGQPETGAYPLRGNYSTTAVQKPRTRSRASSIASRFRRPSSYAGPPTGNNGAPFLPEPHMGGFQTNDLLDGADYPPSPDNGSKHTGNMGLERDMNNMVVTDQPGQRPETYSYDHNSPLNFSPQAPRADHVSPTGATMRKIEPESHMARQPPSYQPQLISSTTTHTVTTTYPRSGRQQHSHQPDVRHSVQDGIPQQYPQQSHTRQPGYSNAQTLDPDPGFDQRLDGPYPRGNDRSPGGGINRNDGITDRKPRQVMENVSGELYPRQQRLGQDKVSGVDPKRGQRQVSDNVTDDPYTKNRRLGGENASDDFVGRKNSIPRKPVDPSTNFQSLPKTSRRGPTEPPAQPHTQRQKIAQKIGSTGGPTAEQVIAGARSNTYDTQVVEKVAPAIVQETVNKKVHHVQEEQITKEIHTHDVFHRILPIIDVEVLPTRHFLPVEGGGLVEIGADEVPGRAKNWVVAETASKIASNQPAPKAVSRFTARDFPGTDGDFEKSVAPAGYEQTKTTWVHAPTLETGAQATGQTWPFEFDERPPDDEGTTKHSRGSSKSQSHRKAVSKRRSKDISGVSSMTGHDKRSSVPL